MAAREPDIAALARRLEAMMPELELIVEDYRYRRRRRDDHGRTVKAWQIRVGIAAGAVTITSVLVGSVLQILHVFAGG